MSIDQPLSQPVTLYVPSGTVCLECIIDGDLATDASFQIGISPVSPSDGRVVNGTLVVFDSESLFSTSIHVRCSSGTVTHQANVEHSSKFYLKCVEDVTNWVQHCKFSELH